MKQVFQDLRSGKTLVQDVPAPAPRDGHLQIATTCSLVSAGTERMLVDFARGSLVSKARQQPEKVRQALEKMKTDGVVSTIEAIRSKLDQPLILGNCNVGRVMAIGDDVDNIDVGDRVVSNGNHAEIVVVPKNLCARIPDCVDDENAAFTVLGAIALQGVRLAQPTLGETIVVTGLGLIGLMTVQILRANGCRVLGIDKDTARIRLARQFGAEVVDLSKGEDPLDKASTFSRGRGVDGVLLTANTTSSEPVSQAANMCRKRGRIILVGITGLELNRADFYDKEISFQVSCSYGPGRYDAEYEEKGHDYPLGYVRWTEQRNLEAVLDLMAAGQLDVRSLITHRFDVDDAAGAYDLLVSGEPSLGILIRYPEGSKEQPSKLRSRTVNLSASAAAQATGAAAAPVVGFIGAGNYAGRVLIPAFKSAGIVPHALVTSGGVSATHYGRKFGFGTASTDPQTVLDDPSVNAVVIATRHDTHAGYVLSALKAGKNVFVEKPLCLTSDELDEIRGVLEEAAIAGPVPLLMVGFNRRFAPQVQKIKALLDGVPGSKSFVMTVNAGAVQADHWTQDPTVGGGRIVGEACHFIDLLRYLAGSQITGSARTGMDSPNGDTANLQLSFADGSIGTVHYFANGSKAYPKERLEVFCSGRVLRLDNFRRLRGFGWPGFKRMNLWRQDKGQRACAAAFVEAIRGGEAPIPLEEIIEVSRVTIELAAHSKGAPAEVPGGDD